MVEIFKTNVNDSDLAKQFEDQLMHLYHEYLVNFDLEDCDRILRVESLQGHPICHQSIIALIQQEGFTAEVLND